VWLGHSWMVGGCVWAGAVSMAYSSSRFRWFQRKLRRRQMMPSGQRWNVGSWLQWVCSTGIAAEGSGGGGRCGRCQERGRQRARMRALPSRAPLGFLQWRAHGAGVGRGSGAGGAPAGRCGTPATACSPLCTAPQGPALGSVHRHSPAPARAVRRAAWPHCRGAGGARSREGRRAAPGGALGRGCWAGTWRGSALGRTGCTLYTWRHVTRSSPLRAVSRSAALTNCTMCALGSAWRGCRHRWDGVRQAHKRERRASGRTVGCVAGAKAVR
jgi:hypothetical protein